MCIAILIRRMLSSLLYFDGPCRKHVWGSHAPNDYSEGQIKPPGDALLRWLWRSKSRNKICLYFFLQLSTLLISPVRLEFCLQTILESRVTSALISSRTTSRAAAFASDLYFFDGCPLDILPCLRSYWSHIVCFYFMVSLVAELVKVVWPALNK